jgi:hypothetical protein
MKTCQCCLTQSPNDEATCPNCGQASWAESVDEAPTPKLAREPEPKKGKR